MKIIEQLSRAIFVAATAHMKQLDRGGRPYFLHCQAVADGVDDDVSKIVAYLHDILEDTDTTVQDLEMMGFDQEIIDSIVLLTKTKDKSEDQYYQDIKKSKVATNVKKSDLRHNMNLSRLKKVTDKDILRNKKYYNRLLELSQ